MIVNSKCNTGITHINSLEYTGDATAVEVVVGEVYNSLEDKIRMSVDHVGTVYDKDGVSMCDSKYVTCSVYVNSKEDIDRLLNRVKNRLCTYSLSAKEVNSVLKEIEKELSL